MITLVDTIRAISDALATLFGSHPVTKDIDEGVERPCTYVEPVPPIETERYGALRIDTYTIRIFRFEEERETGYLDLLQDWEKLQNVFENPIPVSDTFLLYPEDIKFDISRADMALSVEFTVQNAQEVDEAEEAETMQNLAVDVRKD